MYNTHAYTLVFVIKIASEVDVIRTGYSTCMPPACSFPHVSKLLAFILPWSCMCSVQLAVGTRDTDQAVTHCNLSQISLSSFASSYSLSLTNDDDPGPFGRAPRSSISPIVEACKNTIYESQNSLFFLSLLQS